MRIDKLSLLTQTEQTLRPIAKVCSAFKNFVPAKIVCSEHLLRDFLSFYEEGQNVLKLQKYMTDIGFQSQKDRLYVIGDEALAVKILPLSNEHRGEIYFASFNSASEMHYIMHIKRRNDGTWDINGQHEWGNPETVQALVKKHGADHVGVPDTAILNGHVEQNIMLITFLEFITIKEVFVAHKSSYKPERGSKIKNITGHEIIVADVNWNYNLVRDTPFSVKGHWRMQPYGEGRSKLKLKWIEGFVKQGYKREAGRSNLESK